MDIQGTAAIVTGGGSGLGAATAQRLADRGAMVTILDLNRDVGQAAADRIGAQFFAVDITDGEAVDASMRAAENQHGKAQILVNCAGIATPGKVLDRDGAPLALAKFANVISVNLMGTFNTISRFASLLHDSKSTEEELGVIVNTASVAAFDGQIGQPAYAASKAGIVGMTLPIARELARSKIRVMTIAPGIFMTPMLASLPPETQESLGTQIPFPSRLGHPDEFAQLVEAIVTNPMLNGETIRLDGAIRLAPK